MGPSMQRCEPGASGTQSLLLGDDGKQTAQPLSTVPTCECFRSAGVQAMPGHGAVATGKCGSATPGDVLPSEEKDVSVTW